MLLGSKAYSLNLSRALCCIRIATTFTILFSSFRAELVSYSDHIIFSQSFAHDENNLHAINVSAFWVWRVRLTLHAGYETEKGHFIIYCLVQSTSAASFYAPCSSCPHSKFINRLKEMLKENSRYWYIKAHDEVDEIFRRFRKCLL